MAAVKLTEIDEKANKRKAREEVVRQRVLRDNAQASRVSVVNVFGDNYRVNIYKEDTSVGEGIVTAHRLVDSQFLHLTEL